MSKIYVKPIGGLCNRLRAIDSMLWVAEDCGKRLVVIWERNQSLNCSFEDLFVKPASFDLLEIKHSWFWPSKHIHSFPEVLPKSLHQRLMVGLLKSRLGVNTTFSSTNLPENSSPFVPLRPLNIKMSALLTNTSTRYFNR